jgi:hypothetical protein
MALQMFYRGIWFAKDYIIKYLNYIFMANQKGQIVFTDGTREIKFSSTPIAVKRASWTTRVLPAVLIGKASGGLSYITFSKDRLKSDHVLNDDGVTVDNYLTVGGNFDINIQLAVRATTIEERDNLVDVTGIYLAHPDTKDYFERHYLLLPEAPKLGTESDIKETGIDYPIFETTMGLRVISRWQEWSKSEDDRLLNIVSDAESYTLEELELEANLKRTILD